jgi:hypothetical protein
MSKTTARPRILWQRDLPFNITTIRPKGVIGRQYRKLMAFDLSAAAHAERVEQVAKALCNLVDWKAWLRETEAAKQSWRKYATAALAALSKDL